MAVATLIIYEGRSEEVKRKLHEGIAQVIMRELELEPGKVRVIIQEVGPGDYSVGGVPV